MQLILRTAPVTTHIEVEQAKRDLGKLPDRAAQGEDIVLTADGTAKVRMVPLSDEEARQIRRRRQQAQAAQSG